MISLSLKNLESERSEIRKDIFAFRRSFDVLRKRLLEVSESTPSRLTSLERWAGTWASMGSLELSISVLEQKLTEIDDHIMQIQTGEILNSDLPRKGLSVMDGGIE